MSKIISAESFEKLILSLSRGKGFSLSNRDYVETASLPELVLEPRFATIQFPDYDFYIYSLESCHIQEGSDTWTMMVSSYDARLIEDMWVDLAESPPFAIMVNMVWCEVECRGRITSWEVSDENCLTMHLAGTSPVMVSNVERSVCNERALA